MLHYRRATWASRIAGPLLASSCGLAFGQPGTSTAEPDATSAIAVPDLVVQRIEYMDCAPRVGVTVYNQGSVPARSPFDVRLASIDSATNQMLNAVQSVGGLGAFSSTRLVFDLPSRDVYWASADPFGVIKESNARNNELRVPSRSILTCPTISVSGGTAVEGSAVRFQLRISHAFTQPVRVSYVTEDRSARGTDFGLVGNGTTACSADFVHGRGTVEFPAGTAELVQFVDVATCIDGAAEAAELFALRLTEVINGRLAAANSGLAEGRIEDGRR